MGLYDRMTHGSGIETDGKHIAASCNTLKRKLWEFQLIFLNTNLRILLFLWANVIINQPLLKCLGAKHTAGHYHQCVGVSLLTTPLVTGLNGQG